ncbi:ribosomal protein S6 kinase-like 1 isoform X2 [Ambystoma mexicanum]|uniref:ribosomal protein S6 kinase-like 1 isoform X2 n=1 Tax=Ambystoma mexicanum TaxID=8296 RepID=UPI0037E84782
MNRACKEHQPGPEAEAFSKALSQAWVYIEQIRSRVSVGGPNMQSVAKSASIGAKRDYLVDAAKQIRLALERDVNEDYEAAFNHYKNGVDLLLGGIQVESNKERREAVKRKVAQYLKRAEEIFNSHLQRALGNGFTTTEGYSSLRFRPIRNLSFPIENLRMCKVVGIIDKSLLKSHMERRGQQTIIPQGVPYMVKLLRYYVSEDSIFLRLQHVQGGKLWSHLRRQLHHDMERGKEYPECSSPFRKTVKLKNSYTTPSISTGLEQGESCWNWEGRSTWDDASRTSNLSSPDSDHLSPGKSHSSASNQSGSWEEYTSKSSSRETPLDPSVVGHGAQISIPSCTICIGPVNDIKEAARRQETWFTVTHPNSLTAKTSHISQRESTQENSPATRSDQDLWSPESQTLVDSFRNLQAKVPSHEHLCHNGNLPQDGIPALDSKQRISADAIAIPGTQPAISKMEVIQNVSCNGTKLPADIKTSNGHSVPEAPFACTESCSSLSTDLHFRPLSGKELQKVISGSVAGTLPPKTEQGTRHTCESHGTVVPAPLVRDTVTGPGLGSCNASPDIEVDGWCFVSAPPPSAADTTRGAQGPWGLPEHQIQQWAAEILLALEGLHQQGVMCQDLNPRNVLLDDAGHICLTYFGQWPEVEPQFSNRALEELYTAPEVCGITEVTEACDWWSFGALLYELLTGMSLSQNHPSGIHTHSRLHLPDTLSCAAASLLTELLQCDPGSRLGAGADGISKIKSHPFFRTIQWNQLL